MKVKNLLWLAFVCSFASAQSYWTPVSKRGESKIQTQDPAEYQLNLAAIQNDLSKGAQVSIPLEDGTFEMYTVQPHSNFAPELQAKYPQIQSYIGHNKKTGAEIRISVSPRGISATRFAAGEPLQFIEKINTNDPLNYRVYKASNKGGKNGFTCLTEDEGVLVDEVQDATKMADDGKLRTFRLAMSTNGEYTIYHGGTVEGALAGINATLTRVNGVFEREMALHLQLIANTDQVIFTDPSTDPYSPSYSYWNGELQSTLTSIIGEANYDIGHMFGASGGGGNAGCIGCVCVDGQKGSGITSPADGKPEGDNFDIDYVAHEMGHQLGANHTFSRSEGTGANMEPGSASTIMGYAGITGPSTDIQAHSDDYFHFISIKQVTDNIKNKSCPTITEINNTAPVADAGADYTIPADTPFILTGSGTDADGDALTYCWEQADVSSSNSYVAANPNSTTLPLFRSFTPTTDNFRVFPSMDKVLAGNFYSPFEALPSVSRTMKFNLTVRDDQTYGQNGQDQTIISVIKGDEPFGITYPTLDVSVKRGHDLNITWNVAGTNAAPYNSPNVNIYLAVNGQDFVMVKENTPNDGEETIVVPNTNSKDAKIMIKSAENIFFQVSQPFLIGYKAVSTCNQYNASGLPKAIKDGSGAGNPNYGSYSIGKFSVSDDKEVGFVEVGIDIDHVYISDLQLLIQAPSNDRVVLWDHNCKDQDHINTIFSDYGTVLNCNNMSPKSLPANSLSVFKNTSSKGNWVVAARDGFNGDTGTFNASSLNLCQVTYEELGVENVQTTNTLKVYPNPAKDKATVSLTLEGKGVKVNVYNTTGQVVKSLNYPDAAGSFSYEINLANLPAGNYIVQVENNGKVLNTQLLKK